MKYLLIGLALGLGAYGFYLLRLDGSWMQQIKALLVQLCAVVALGSAGIIEAVNASRE